jgi:hypothetical protein
VSSYQEVQLIEKENHKRILMIGGIKIFLPRSQDKVREDVAGATTVKGQPTMIVEEMEKISEASQEKEEEHLDNMLTPW